MAVRDQAELLFEPTGDVVKDYSAYCEIEDKPEREDFLDGISKTEVAETPAGTTKQRTSIVLRNLDAGLYKRDSQPLINAMPHCLTLHKVLLTNCLVTEHTYKLLVEAIYKSPTMTSFAVDFNGMGLLKDPTVSKKDKNDIMVSPSQYRGAHLRINEPEVKEDKKGKDKRGAAAKPVQPAVTEEPVQEKPPITIPSGWHSILLTGIQQLSLRGNGITDAQVEQLCPLLEGNTELLALSLWGNSISSTGACQIAKALHANRKLTALNLGHNKIDDVGVAALSKCFYSEDVSNEEALRVRQKVYPTQMELPVLPTYADLCAAAAQPPAEDPSTKKDPKKKDAGKGKGAVLGPVERPKNEFDKDCVRLDENTVRIPGNWSLWAINLSHNVGVTPTGVKTFTHLLTACEPDFEALSEQYHGIGAPGADLSHFHVTVDPYVCSLALENLDFVHPKMPEETLNELNAALEARKAASLPKSPAP